MMLLVLFLPQQSLYIYRHPFWGESGMMQPYHLSRLPLMLASPLKAQTVRRSRLGERMYKGQTIALQRNGQAKFPPSLHPACRVAGLRRRRGEKRSPCARCRSQGDRRYGSLALLVRLRLIGIFSKHLRYILILTSAKFCLPLYRGIVPRFGQTANASCIKPHSAAVERCQGESAASGKYFFDP